MALRDHAVELGVEEMVIERILLLVLERQRGIRLNDADQLNIRMAGKLPQKSFDVPVNQANDRYRKWRRLRTGQIWRHGDEREDQKPEKRTRARRRNLQGEGHNWH